MPTLIARPSCCKLLREAVRIHTGAQQEQKDIRIVESKNLAAHFLISEGKRSTAVVLFSLEDEKVAESRDPGNLLAPILQDIEVMGSTFGADRSICLMTFQIKNPFPLFSRLHNDVWCMEPKKRPKMMEMPHWVSQAQAIAGLLYNLPHQQDVATECQEYAEAFLRSEHVTQPIVNALLAVEENAE